MFFERFTSCLQFHAADESSPINGVRGRGCHGHQQIHQLPAPVYEATTSQTTIPAEEGESSMISGQNGEMFWCT